MSKSKIRIGIIFGGRSAEHEVSLVSATSIIRALDRNKYEVIPIGITSEGKWVSAPGVLSLLKSRKPASRRIEKTLLPDPSSRNLVTPNRSGTSREKLDVIFPVLHGSFGEDGTMQGFLELADLPYVGAGVLGSSVGMDKVITKQLCEHAGIPVTPYVWFIMSEYARRRKQIFARVEQKLKYPYFVKPANTGSSVGISKVRNRKELISAIELAAEYDRKILVEQGIENAREIEVSVLGNDDPIASVPGEIIPSNEFYDYDAKYVDGKSQSIVPARLHESVAKTIRQFAVASFKAIDCCGMARVDFLVTKRTNHVCFNELNTIPGFTSISMYPKLWEASGLSFGRLVDRLVELAIERHRQKQRLKTVFVPKSNWFAAS